MAKKKDRNDRKDGKGPAGERLATLLDAGDHAAAGAEARVIVADPGAGEAEKAEAARVLASLAPDRGVALTGAAGVVVAVVIGAWTLLAGR